MNRMQPCTSSRVVFSHAHSKKSRCHITAPSRLNLQTKCNLCNRGLPVLNLGATGYPQKKVPQVYIRNVCREHVLSKFRFLALST